MITTLIGIILLLIPFLAIILFSDKRKGFFYIITFMIFFHLAAAILTQFFGIFNYPIVISINIVFCAIVLIKVKGKKIIENLKQIKIDWIFVFVLIILLIELYSVHYNYSGKITDITQNIKEVKNMKYAYPYYSDEWSAVSFAKYSIETGKLPFANHLWHDIYFPNPEFVFHSFISDLFLILDLNLLTNMGVLGIFSGILICILAYFILRLNEISRFASAITALSVPYIVNGANLPGIWYLIPLVLGIICLLLSFVFISIRDNKMVIFSSFLTLLFYPPLFVLSVFSLIFYFMFSEISKKEKIKYVLIYFLICFGAALIISFKLIFGSSEGFNFLEYIFSKLYYMTFTKDSIPDYSIWKIIPIWSLLFIVFGFKEIKKKLWLIAPIAIGLGYWLLYSHVFWRFIIEYQRVVVASSVLIVLFSGFGLDNLVKYIENKHVNLKKTLKLLLILILAAFLIASFYYTSNNNWGNLVLYSNGKKVADPAPPANNYLSEEELELFKNIKEKNFIAPSWKGLVIGAATDNYALESKQSTITNLVLKYSDFIGADCKKKSDLAIKYSIAYAYSSEFNCTGFELAGKTKENLFLYKFS